MITAGFLTELEQFPARLAEIRQARHASYDVVSAATGVTKSGLWKIEHGKASPSLTTATKIVRWMLEG
jgi:transcriptional regulator with XRE-family HTH domain